MSHSFVYMRDAVGKVVKDVIEPSWEGEAFILFTDGTFTRFEVSRAQHGDESDSLSNCDREKAHYRDSVGIKLGFWTEATLAAEKADIERRERDARIKRDREQYEQLKRRFEGGT